MNDAAERKESIKSGSCGAVATGLGYAFVAPSISWCARSGLSIPLHPFDFDLNFLVQVAIAATGGFLFGMTYRYIIRTDRNHHLKSGAVLAFGLVRGLARVQVTRLELVEMVINGVMVLESLLVFAIARYTLDYALSLGWILPFEIAVRRQPSSALSLSRSVVGDAE
jgi:hypothetical protein